MWLTHGTTSAQQVFIADLRLNFLLFLANRFLVEETICLLLENLAVALTEEVPALESCDEFSVVACFKDGALDAEFSIEEGKNSLF